jgi:4-hydroxyphenylacetate 3-monooxygenase
MSFTEAGDAFSMYYLRARIQEDLRRRMRAHQMIAEMTYGLLGRSPDHVASFVTGLAVNPTVCAAGTRPYAENLVKYYRYVRERDIYAAYAVLPPQAARDPAFYQEQNLPIPSLQVVGEDDDGVVISGIKMLATGAVFADEIWIGNLLPLAPDQVKQAVTCAVSCNAEGLSLWSRQPFEVNAKNEFDSPLALRRERQHGHVRQCQGALGARLCDGRRGAVARNLHSHAEPLLWKPPIERPPLVETPVDRRPGEPRCAIYRR